MYSGGAVEKGCIDNKWVNIYSQWVNIYSQNGLVGLTGTVINDKNRLKRKKYG